MEHSELKAVVNVPSPSGRGWLAAANGIGCSSALAVMATSPQRSGQGRCVDSCLTHQCAQEERCVRGSLGKPAHEVPIPLIAVGNIDPNGIPCGGQTSLLVRPDAVKELELVLTRGEPVRLDAVLEHVDQPGV